MHPAHRHGIVGDDQIARVGFARHRLQQVAEPLDIGVVQRRIHLVQHADRRGVGEKQREDQRHGGQRLFPARQQRERLQRLPGGWAKISSPPPADHPNRPAPDARPRPP
jgi:hypothetical protein